MAYPLESWLRPAYELRGALASAVAAGMLVARPELFMLTPSLTVVGASVLGLHSVWRVMEAAMVIRYRRNLRRLKHYVLEKDAIPSSQSKLFLGRGFRWDQRHTQRLYDAQQPHNRPYCEPGRLYRWARAVELSVDGTVLSWLSKWTTSSTRWNPVAPLPDVGGNPALHGVELDEGDVWMNLSERVGHTLVLGTTRMGKTRLAELLIAQDIRRGEVVIVFDPKGDPGLLARVYDEARRAGRASAFYMFHLGYPELSARYNPIGSFSRVTEVATRIAGQLPAEGQSAAFREFVWRFVNVIARALVALGRTPGYEEINRHAVNIEPLLIDYYEFWLDHTAQAADWRNEVQTLQIDKKTLNRGLQSRGLRAVALVEYANRKHLYDPIAHALASTLSYEKSYFDKLVASLLPLLEKLTTGKMPDTIVRNAYLGNQLAVRCAMLTTQLAVVKLVLAFAYVPLIVLFYSVAMADGFAQRSVWRASAGHESSALYHRAKYMQMGTLTLSVAAYVVLPSRGICHMYLPQLRSLSRRSRAYNGPITRSTYSAVTSGKASCCPT